MTEERFIDKKEFREFTEANKPSKVTLKGDTIEIKFGGKGIIEIDATTNFTEDPELSFYLLTLKEKEPKL